MNRAAATLTIAIAACAGSSPAPVQPTTAAAPAPATTPAAAPISNATAGDSAASSDDGGDTAVMAKRWASAAYFNAMKHKVSQNWDPAGVWRALPTPQQSSVGTSRRVTELEVELAPDGRLVKIAVLRTSGVVELDGEAIRAFQVSSPFGTWPNGVAPRPFKFGFEFQIGGTSSMSVTP